MSQKDWKEVQNIIDNLSPALFKNFLESEEIFLPNHSMPNPFNQYKSNFSASDLGKGKPGQWIPVYYIKDIPEFFRENSMVLVRAGPAEFFFYRGRFFFLIFNM